LPTSPFRVLSHIVSIHSLPRNSIRHNMANNVDIAGPCPCCGQDSLILACSDIDRDFSFLPMCTEVPRCEWTGIMLTEPRACYACEELIPAGSPACTTRVYASHNPRGFPDG
ncbi:unnamed protein product, partial [Ectocarpus fasciculatus]